MKKISLWDMCGSLLCALIAFSGSIFVAPAASAETDTASGGKIAFVRGHHILTINQDGTDETVLTPSGKNFFPSWSPNGEQIAYVHETASHGRDLWLINADGTGQTAVTTSGHIAAGSPSWSPDGTTLAFGGPCIRKSPKSKMCKYVDEATVLDTISATAPHGKPTTLTGNPRGTMGGVLDVLDGVAWSANGENIALVSDNFPSIGDLYLLVYEVADRGVVAFDMVGYSGLEGRFANPAFSPDSSLIAYDSFVNAQGDIQHRGIALCDYALRSCDQFRDVAHDSHISFAPAQDRVVVARTKGQDHLVLADLDGTNRTRLTAGGQPSWRPVAAV